MVQDLDCVRPEITRDDVRAWLEMMQRRTFRQNAASCPFYGDALRALAAAEKAELKALVKKNSPQ